MAADAESVKRTAKAIWTAQGGVPDRFEREWARDPAFVENWSAYAAAVRADVLDEAARIAEGFDNCGVDADPRHAIPLDIAAAIRDAA